MHKEHQKKLQFVCWCKFFLQFSHRLNFSLLRGGHGQQIAQPNSEQLEV